MSQNMQAQTARREREMMTTSHKTKWREALIKQDAIAAARLDGERVGYVKAMRDVESNGLVKNGYVTIPISLLNILKENNNVS
jgi:hypothetical protein